MNVTHVIVHTPEQVLEILVQADKIARDHGGSAASMEALFSKACDLLGQRQTIVVQDAPVAVDLSKLRAAG